MQFYSENMKIYDAVREQIRIQKKTVKEVRASNLEAAHLIANELESQNKVLTESIKTSSDDIVTQLQSLENKLCKELSEIRWQLIQVTGLLERTVFMLNRPRGTEAQELVRQGVLNFNNGKFEEAEERFLKALVLDNTDYQVLYNLGFIEINKKNFDKALAYLKDAYTLPDNIKATAKSDVLYTIADVYYQQGKYDDALSACLKAIEIKESPKRIYRAAVYSFTCSRLDLGEQLLKSSIQKDHNLYAVTASDQALNLYKKIVFEILNDLAISYLTKYENNLKTVPAKLHTLKRMGSSEFVKGIEKIFKDTKNTAMKSFSDIVNGLQKLSKVDAIIEDCNTLDSLYTERCELDKYREKTQFEQNRLAKVASICSVPMTWAWLGILAIYLCFGFLLTSHFLHDAHLHNIHIVFCAVFWIPTFFIAALSPDLSFGEYFTILGYFVLAVLIFLVICEWLTSISDRFKDRAKSKQCVVQSFLDKTNETTNILNNLQEKVRAAIEKW
jgi:tetratricopeptide (TPR) repeat protein